jgi:hypothetical protein
MKWFLLFPCWFLFNLFALCVNWFLPVFATMQEGPVNDNNGVGTEPRLPSYLSWFMTEDNSLLGDGGFKETHDCGYWSQVAWLYRNSAYGFERSVLAAKIKPGDRIYSEGDRFVQDKPMGRAGTFRVFIGEYWSYDRIIQITKTQCMKISLGWKLKTYAEDTTRLITQPCAQYCVTIKPITQFIESTS